MNDQLDKFVMAAKAILYNKDRAAKLLAMLTTKSGTMTAVHTIMSVIGQKKPIPPEIAPGLALAIFSLLLDMAKKVTGKIPPKQAIAEVAKSLAQDVAQQKQPKQQVPMQPQQPMQPPQPAGLINQGAPA